MKQGPELKSFKLKFLPVFVFYIYHNPSEWQRVDVVEKNLWRHPYIPVWILLEHWNDDVSFVVFVCFTWQTYLVIFSMLPDINICKLIMQVWKNMQNFHTKTENVFNLYLSNQPKFFVVRPNEKLHLFHPFNLFAATIFL